MCKNDLFVFYYIYKQACLNLPPVRRKKNFDLYFTTLFNLVVLTVN